MSLKNTALLVSENLTGANGDMERPEIIRDVASALVDVIFERLLDQGIRFEDQNIYREIESLVAQAMVVQAEADLEDLNHILKAA